MTAKVITCVLALLIQTISAQIIGNMYGPGMVGSNLAAVETAALAGAAPGLAPYGPVNGLPFPAEALAYEAALAPVPGCGCGFGLKLSDLAANGGGFAVTSTSPIAPNGVTVLSENLMFEGPLAVTGKMPFLGSVGLEGPLPATGQGAVAYGCGNGEIGILNEEFPVNIVNAALNIPGPMGPNPAMAGYNGMGPRGPYGPMYY